MLEPVVYYLKWVSWVELQCCMLRHTPFLKNKAVYNITIIISFNSRSLCQIKVMPDWRFYLVCNQSSSQCTSYHRFKKSCKKSLNYIIGREKEVVFCVWTLIGSKKLNYQAMKKLHILGSSSLLVSTETRFLTLEWFNVSLHKWQHIL